ncbi:MAG: S-layer homology domain-containing protein [Clostridia bacterium]|nr:S-layer homology domain-containing protein [Clostridia bacterium]
MKKLLAAILTLTVFLGAFAWNAGAANVIERDDVWLHLPGGDGTVVGGNWGGTWTNYQPAPEGGTQKALYFDGAQGIYRGLQAAWSWPGNFDVTFDVYPTTAKSKFVFIPRTLAGGKTQWDQHAVSLTEKGKLLVDNANGGVGTSGGVSAGYYVENVWYRFKLHFDYVKHVYDVWLLEGTLKETKEGEAVQVTNQHLGQFALRSNAVGLVQINIDGKDLYLDEFCARGGNIEYGIGDGSDIAIEVGATTIPIYLNQALKMATKDQIAVTKNGTALKVGTDYTVSYDIPYNGVQTNVGLGLKITLTEAAQENDTFTIDLSSQADFMDTRLSGAILTVPCVSSETLAQFNAAVEGVAESVTAENPGVDLTAVTENLTMPSAGLNNSEITWKSSTDPSTLSISGEVTRPAYSDEQDTSKTVTLKGTVTMGGLSKEFSLEVVVKMEMPAESWFALRAAATQMEALLPEADAVLSDTLELPESYTVEEYTDGTVDISYQLEGDGADYFKIENGVGKPEGKLLTDFEGDGTEFDAQVTVTATLTKGAELPRVISRTYTIPHRHILTGQTSSTEAAAVLDTDPATVWTAEGTTANLDIPLKTEMVIGDIRAVNSSYDNLKWYYQGRAKSWQEVTEFPVAATALRAEVTKAGGGIQIGSVEAILTDAQLLKFDIQGVEIEDSLNQITASFIKLPLVTEHGLELVWESSNPNAIDKFGTVKHQSTEQSVTLTARGRDSKGAVIEGIQKTFSATVQAKTASNQGNTVGSYGGVGRGSGGRGGNVVDGTFPATTPMPVAPPTQTAPPEQQPERFSDMADSWAKEAVYALAEKNIVNGNENGQFLPDNNITREEFVKLLVCAFDINAEKKAIFSDVADGAWYADYVCTAGGAGLVQGAYGAFGVGQSLTRQDLALMVARIMKVKESDATATYTDWEQVRQDAKAAVAALSEAGILSGYPDASFRPEQTATRAEATLVLYKVMEKMGKN